MKLRIALAGELPSDRRIFGKIDVLLGQISGYLCKDYAEVSMQVLVSPSYTGSVWMEWSETHDFSVCTYNMQESSDFMERCDQTVRMATTIRSYLGEAMCDRADAVLIVWNEDAAELSGATWEFIRSAYDRKLPCIWISSKSQQTYCLWESYYKKYIPQYLSAVCEPLRDEELAPSPVVEERGYLMSFWEKQRARYLKKYKADKAVFPSVEDCLLKRDFPMEEEMSAGEAVRGLLLDKFNQFDCAAIQLNTRFQSLIYQRSILPFIATIFLAVGLYTETLVGQPLTWLMPGVKGQIEMLALLLAEAGFVIYGCLNLYVYCLSKSQRVSRWQGDFVTDRYMAEMLRVLIHFLPYGVTLDLCSLCGGDRRLYAAMRHLTDEVEPAEREIGHKTIVCVLRHLREMLGDQLAYHEASANRYRSIVDTLEKWGRRVFYAGFGIAIIHRGGIQLILMLLKNGNASPAYVDMAADLLNMLALLLPAWAGYFSTKAQQNNFKYNLDNHRNMISRLQAIRERIDYLSGQEEISMEVFSAIAGELAETMLVEDSSGWRHRYMNASARPLS